MNGRIWIPEAPHLITRPTREAFFDLPAVPYAGKFEVELIHSRTGLIAQRLEFNNIITDVGMDRLGGLRADNVVDQGLSMIYTNTSVFTGAYPLNYCAVGTGSTVPAVTDTQLNTEVARTNANGGFGAIEGRAADNSYSFVRVTKEFTESQANGNLTEVGFLDGPTAGAGTLFTRQLFRDAAGNPVTVTKTSEYKLRVIYEFRVYPPLTDFTGTATINGTAVNYTGRAMEIDNQYFWNANAASITQPDTSEVYLYTDTVLPALTASPTGTWGNLTSSSYAAYVRGTYYREGTGIAMADKANGTWRTITLYRSQWGSVLRSPARFALLLDTAFTKTNTEKLTITWRGHWARHTIT